MVRRPAASLRTAILWAALGALLVPAGARGDGLLRCGPFEVVGRLALEEIQEASGLAVSRRNPGVLWVHNDSGDRPRLFAVTTSGRLLGIFVLKGARAVDWEDMAAGPCPSPEQGPCLFVGDIGDNLLARPTVQIYRVKEPEVPLEGSPVHTELDDVVRADYRYPEGSRNAEVLIADGRSGELYIVTKDEASRTEVYRVPDGGRPGQPMTLEKVAVLPLRASLTAGDASFDASRIILRDYDTAFEYACPPGGALVEAFRAIPQMLPLPLQLQGEGLAMGPADEVYTCSEGEDTPIYRARCSVVHVQDGPAGGEAQQ